VPFLTLLYFTHHDTCLLYFYVSYFIFMLMSNMSFTVYSIGDGMSEEWSLERQALKDIAKNMGGSTFKSSLRKFMNETIVKRMDPRGKHGGVTEKNFQAKWAQTTLDLLVPHEINTKKCRCTIM
jgi:hypothetical protein